MKLRRRLLVTIAGLSLATLGGAFTAVYMANNRAQLRQLDAALVYEAREEAREAAQAGGERLMISARPGPQANDVGPLTKYAVIYGPNGTIIASTPTFEGAPPAYPSIRDRREPFDLWHGTSHLRGVLVPIPAAPHTRLLLAAPRSDLDGDEAFLARAMLVVFAFAFGWVLMISSWVVRRFTRGHEAVAAVARAVARGDLTARVERTAEDDEVAQLARDVNHMIAQLGSLMMSHRLFIAHAAHELRSPLTALYGELSHALRKARDAESYRSAIAEALDSTKRLMSLAEDLLALARLSSSAEERRERVELLDALQRAVRWLEAAAQEREVSVQLTGCFGTTWANGSDLERLFRNLLENAIRYSPRNAIVRVTCASEGGEHAITIENQGSIAGADRKHLFEPFFRGADTGDDSKEGTGLGLPIARQIAWAHDGSVECLDSAPGTVLFRIALPTAEAPRVSRPNQPSVTPS